MRILVTDGMDKTAMAQLREMGHEVVEQFYDCLLYTSDAADE